MLQPYATDELLDGVKRDCFLATSDENWSDTRILGVAHDVIIGEIAPKLKDTKQNWFHTIASVTLASNTRSYDLPTEAMFGSVEAIHLCEIATSRIVSKLTLAYPQTIQYYQDLNPSAPACFYLDQTQITLASIPDASSVQNYYLQVSYYRRSPKLVLTTNVCNATVINSASLTLTTTSQPSYLTTNAPDSYASVNRIDVTNRLTPYTRKLVNATCTFPSLTSIVFNGSITSTNVATIAVGDVISVYGTTIFPDLPPEVMPLLRRFVAREIKMAQGATDYQRYADRLKEDWITALHGLGKRTDGTPTKLSLYNAGGVRALSLRRYRRW